MEDHRVRKLGLVFLAGALILPWSSLAYEVDTHRGLTKATAETYELSAHKDLSQEEIEAVTQGASDEDESPRPLNHFFDPVNQRGLKVGVTWPASKVWAEDTRSQASFCAQNWCLDSNYFTYTQKLFGSVTDYSWDRAIYEYVHGDKIRGLQGLGHILHLLQDSAVPAHVRNDQHLNKWGIGDFDPYEKFAGKYSVDNISNLGAINYPKRVDLPDYFDALAIFTNTNFISKDALFNKYPAPSLEKMDISEGFARNTTLKNRVAIIQGEFNRFDSIDNRVITISDSILDPNQLVLLDSWSLLSKEAIRNGVGVMDLFFQAVEKEKQNNELKKKNVSQQEVDAKSIFLKIFGISKNLYGSSLDESDVSDLLDTQSSSSDVAKSNSGSKSQSAGAVTTKLETVKPQVPEVSKPKVKGIVAGVSTSTVTSDGGGSSSDGRIVPITDILPAYMLGGGGNAAGSNSNPRVIVAAPVITTPLENALLGTTSVSIGGTAEANTSIALSATLEGGGTATATTTTSLGGLWNITLSVLEGTTSISVTASDGNGNTSTAAVRSFGSDITAPSVGVFSLLECAHSLVTGGTCAGAGKATPALSIISPDTARYIYVVDGAAAGAVTTLGSVSLTAGVHTVAVAAYDAAGNGATSTAVSITTLSFPFVINEVGWMGTQASVSDHWIELYNNNSGYTVDMSTLRLATDTWTTGALRGSVSSGEMYLVEKSEQVTSVTANYIDPNIAFTSNPVQLLLEYTAGGYATTTLDATPTSGTCGSSWCAGTSDSQRRSMERSRPDIAGTVGTNWNSNNMIARYGSDANSTAINGTVMDSNSLGQHNLVYYNCESPYTTFYIEGGSYIPGSSSCRYYSPTILGQFHYATAFAGTVGSSTQYGGHFTGSVTDTIENGDAVPTGYDVQGQDLFVAVFTIPSGALGTAYLNLFTTYFTTGGNPPPMGNYGIFRFKYGN